MNDHDREMQNLRVDKQQLEYREVELKQRIEELEAENKLLRKQIDEDNPGPVRFDIKTFEQTCFDLVRRDRDRLLEEAKIQRVLDLGH